MIDYDDEGETFPIPNRYNGPSLRESLQRAKAQLEAMVQPDGSVLDPTPYQPPIYIMSEAEARHYKPIMEALGVEMEWHIPEPEMGYMEGTPCATE